MRLSLKSDDCGVRTDSPSKQSKSALVSSEALLLDGAEATSD
jgi:hypothetical protein